MEASIGHIAWAVWWLYCLHLFHFTKEDPLWIRVIYRINTAVAFIGCGYLWVKEMFS